MKCTPDNTQCPLHKELVASDARYQARIKELEEALSLMLTQSTETPSTVQSVEARRIALKALSITTPDTALQRIMLEARIDQVWQCEEYNGVQLTALDEELRAKLAALGE